MEETEIGYVGPTILTELGWCAKHDSNVRPLDDKQRERDLIDAARRGSLTAKTNRPKTLFKAVDAYLEYKRGRARSARTPALEAERLSVVKKHFKDVRLSAITATAIANYQSDRKAAGKSNRTTNMDVAALRRVMKHVGWYVRAGMRLENALRQRRRNNFRTFVHPEAKMHELSTRAGFDLVFQRRTFVWSADVFVRRARAVPS